MFTQYQSYVQKSVGTATTTVVTCPANQQFLVNQISCSNISPGAVTCDVSVTRGGTQAFIVRGANIGAGSSLTCAGREQKVVLMAGDVLSVRSSTATSIDVVVSGVMNDFNRAAVVPTVDIAVQQTFSLSPSATTIAEGDTVVWTVTTTNVPNGTVLFWENIGTVGATDFSDDQNAGTVTITGNSGTFSRTLRRTGVDQPQEGNETIVMVLGVRPRYLGGSDVAGSAPVTVVDWGVSSGLIMYLDAGVPASYSGTGVNWFDLTGNENHVTLQNGPAFIGNAIRFVDSAAQWARTAQNLNLTAFNSVTVDIIVRTSTTAVNALTWEHTANWNANPGGIGLAIHNNGSGNAVNVHHTNHNTGPARNYESAVGTNWAMHTNIFSRVADSTGRLSYVNGQRLPFSTVNGYGTSTATTGGQFANSILYLASRGGGSAFLAGDIAVFRIYNRKLTDAEVLQNYNSFRARFGMP